MSVIHIFHPSSEEIRELVLEFAPGRTIVACRSEVELSGCIDEIEILLTGGLPTHLLAGASKLRWIQNMGAGVDHLLPAPQLDASVQITCSRGIYAPQVAEHAIGLLLSLHRGFPSHVASQLERRWRPFASTPLAGQTLCVLGLGEIGSRVARIASAMGMRVLGVSRTGRPTGDVDEVARPDRLHAMLERSAAAVLALPLTGATRHILDARAIAALPARALVVNVGRGGLIDETALYRALVDGRVGGAALDVFESEPLREESRWWSAPNTLVTPHCSGTTVRHDAGICELFARNLARYAGGETLLGLVNRELGY